MINFKVLSIPTTLLFIFILTACKDQQELRTRQTLESIDNRSELVTLAKKKVNLSRSEDSIRDAYINYLKHSSKQDLSRSIALNRLANIEFKLSEQFYHETKDENIATQLSTLKLDRVINLLETSLNDYPDAVNNDISLYQLAKAYDQKGNYEKTHIVLQQLADKYHDSKFYIEAQFRLAEYAFAKHQYTTAEDKYTEIIIAKKNNVFYEKALYKRAWSRFKQEFYVEAADDFVRAINLNDFSKYKQLNVSKKNLFDEYLRGLALSFSYLDGAYSLNSYLKNSEYTDNNYYIYRSLSAIFFKKQQYNDAVNTLNSFLEYDPESIFAPQAALKIVDIWEEAGFIKKRSLAFEKFYKLYHPNSVYWRNKKNIDKTIQTEINLALKSHILTETATYHKRYQNSKKKQDFLHAQRWYQNYLKHFGQYARQDKIHFLFASLYSDYGDIKNALKHYQLTAFDDQTIMNRAAAYQVILLTTSLYTSNKDEIERNIWLKKLINYSILYAQQYPTDKETLKIIAHTSYIAYQNKQYNNVITLTELAPATFPSTLLNEINITKANAYFHNKQYKIAEEAYLYLVKNKRLNKKDKKSIQESLALAIFYQGNKALQQEEIDQAIQHYIRIIKVAPRTKTAPSGLYDAIALSMKHKKWLSAISYIKMFKKLYPSHKYTLDITKKLSIAYLNSKQDVAAAKELEKLANKDNSRDYKMASLLKAAQLYQKNNAINAAIRTYKKYIKSYKKPFSNYQESLYQLTQLNIKKKHHRKNLELFRQILNTDKKTPHNVKNARTNFIASNAAMALARERHKAFNRIKLTQPLKKHLKNKKRAMQSSVNYYAKASSFGIAETATEATYSIASIYNGFSQSLLHSEIPKNLDEDEKEEYVFLLEDQAFPFEEKAIEFYEVNLNYTNDGIYDQWLEKSLKALQKLFPVRYQREPKLEEVINVLH